MLSSSHVNVPLSDARPSDTVIGRERVASMMIGIYKLPVVFSSFAVFDRFNFSALVLDLSIMGLKNLVIFFLSAVWKVLQEVSDSFGLVRFPKTYGYVCFFSFAFAIMF